MSEKEKVNEGQFNKSLKLVFKSSVIVLIGLVLSKILSYAYRIIIARQFGPEVYGLFSLGIMVTGWFIAFAGFGLKQGIVRYIPRLRGNKEIYKIKYLVKKTFSIIIFTGLVSAIILFSTSSLIAIKIFNEPALIPFLKYFSLAIPFTLLLSIFLSTLRSYEKIAWNTFLSFILETSLKVILVLLLFYLGFGINSIIFSYVLAIFITLVVAFIVTKYKIPEVLFSKQKEEVEKSNFFKEVLSYSWPLLFAGFMWAIFHWTDSFLIGYFQTATEVGIYNAAVPIALLLAMAPQFFLPLFLPLVNKLYAKGNKETIKQLSQQVGKWVVAINLPLLALLALFPGVFIKILFGAEYLGAETALRLLSIGFFFLTFSNVSNKLIEMTGRSRLIFKDVLVVTILNILLNIILIPKYGINGAATATMTSCIVLALVFTFQGKKILSIVPIRRRALNLFLAAIVSSFLLVYVKSLVELTNLFLILLLIFFVAIYILFILLLKGLDRNDIMIFKAAMGRARKKN